MISFLGLVVFALVCGAMVLQVAAIRSPSVRDDERCIIARRLRVGAYLVACAYVPVISSSSTQYSERFVTLVLVGMIALSDILFTKSVLFPDDR